MVVRTYLRTFPKSNNIDSFRDSDRILMSSRHEVDSLELEARASSVQGLDARGAHAEQRLHLRKPPGRSQQYALQFVQWDFLAQHHNKPQM